jgi:hypothetical protein
MPGGSQARVNENERVRRAYEQAVVGDICGERRGSPGGRELVWRHILEDVVDGKTAATIAEDRASGIARRQLDLAHLDESTAPLTRSSSGVPDSGGFRVMRSAGWNRAGKAALRASAASDALRQETLWALQLPPPTPLVHVPDIVVPCSVPL